MNPVVPEKRGVEEPLARRLLALPVQDIGFELEAASVGADFPMRGVRAELTYRFEGTPQANTFAVALTYGLTAGSQGHPIDQVAISPGELPAWLDEHAGFTPSEHFLALHRPDSPDVQEVLEVAEAARSDLRGSLPFDLDPVFVAVLADDDLDYQRVTGRDLLENLPRVAQSVSRFEITPEQYAAHSRHMVVNLDRLKREGTAAQTFKHELVHLALAPVTRPITPGWVTEGAAMYVAGQRPNWTQRVTTGSFESLSFSELSRRSQLGGAAPVGSRAGLEYAYAAAAAFYLVERFGQEAFWDFYEGFAAVEPQMVYDSLPAAPQLDGQDPLAELAAGTAARLVSEHFGMDMEELDQAVRAYAAADT